MKFKEYSKVIKRISPQDLELHPLAGQNSETPPEQFPGFKKDIEMNGQLIPVIVYRGKIVDGRHRKRALEELGMDYIEYEELPNNLTLKEVKARILSTELRRHQNTTQLAIRAYRAKVEKNSEFKTFEEAAATFGANTKRISEVIKIMNKYKRPDIIDILSKGEKINVSLDNTPFYSSSLGTVIKWLETTSQAQMIEIEQVNPKYELSSDEQLFVTSVLNMVNEYSLPVLKEINKGIFIKIKTREEN